MDCRRADKRPQWLQWLQWQGWQWQDQRRKSFPPGPLCRDWGAILVGGTRSVLSCPHPY
jgi:hypothetical protein